jgi:serine protease AprX
MSPAIRIRKSKLASLALGTALLAAPFAAHAAAGSRAAAFDARAARAERVTRVSEELKGKLAAPGAGDLDVIVTYHSQPGTLARTRAERAGGVVARSFERVHAQALRVPARAIEELANDPDVAWVSLDAPIHGSLDQARQTAGLPDPATTSSPWTGAGVTVAVVDSGIAAHADLDNLLAAVDFTDSSRSGEWHDGWGHGTHVAGILAGSGAESSGTYRGIAPGANLISLRVLDDQGVGSTSDAIAAIEWAIEHRVEYGIRVLNLSFGHPVFESAAHDPLVAAAEAAWEAGLVVVCSAGNRGTGGYFTVNSPGNSSRVITVGSLTDWNSSTTSDDAVSSFSSRGPTLIDHFAKPDVIAPGNRVVSTRAAGSAIEASFPAWHVGTGYIEMSGTSQAAPMVAGTVALMLEKEPTLDPDSVKARLMKSATKMRGLPYDVGAGVLDVEVALEMGGYTENAVSPQVFRLPLGVIIAESIGGLWGAGWNEQTIWTDSLLGGGVWGTSNQLGSSALWSTKPKGLGTPGPSWNASLPSGD